MNRSQSRTFWIATCAAAGILASSATAAHAIGYYNLPGSFCQCFGYGNGAGHHACLVLGPSSCRGFCATHEVRVECPPQPPYAYYNFGPYGDAPQGSWLNEAVPTQGAPLHPGPIQAAPEQLPSPTPAATLPPILRQPRVW